tara:strand:+ start:200 stop:661 length:462 start_codon:yes stop_codon:yes gene_type:complete
MSENKCNTLPSYEEQRKALMDKINDTYNKIFSNYQQLNTSNDRDKIPIKNQEQKLEELTEDLLSQLQKSISLIIEQHHIHEAKEKEYQTNKALISKNEQDIKDFKNSKKAREDTHLSTLDDVNKLKLRHTIYLVINIVLLLISVGILVYVYRK